MAITTSILTGGANNHETTSEEANGVYTDFVNEGVVGVVGNTSGVAPATGGFAVNAQGTPAMAVDVTAGVAYVEATPTSQNAQTFRVKSTGTESVVISANSSGSTKYDWVYISMNATNLNTPNLAGTNAATLTTSRSTSASTDDGTPPTYGYPIAVVTVANGASSITNGNIRDIRSQVALDTGTTTSSSGWTTLSSILSTTSGYNKGNKEFEITSSNDVSSVISPGMRLKITRAVTPPTQCLDNELGSSQYASRASASVSGITFTDDFTCEAWIKLESYPGSAMSIVTRYNGTSGWVFQVTPTGTLAILGFNAGAANFSSSSSYATIPLNRWVHVAACLDMSTFTAAGSPIYIDGQSVTTVVARGGTNPTALVNTGNLQIGGENSALFFDGKIADVRVWSAIRTATQIRDNMCQQLVGNETNLVGYWKLDGSFADSTANVNTLTAAGGAAATNVDNPMKTTEYGVVTKVTSTIITVLTGPDHAIPNITLSTPQYSSDKAPLGLPLSLTGPIQLGYVAIRNNYTTTATSNVDVNGLTFSINAVPAGVRLRLRFFTSLMFMSGAVGFSSHAYILEDSNIIARTGFTNAIANYAQHIAIDIPWQPAAGAHTYKIQVLQGAAGTLTLAGEVAAPAYIEVTAEI